MYTDKKFPEFAACRDASGVCVICLVPKGQPHDIRAHDNWDAADNATW